MRADIEQAVALLRRGDQAALEQALGLLQNTVFSFSMRVCGQREDAEDTMQEVLLKSVPYLPKFDSPKALIVWLYWRVAYVPGTAFYPDGRGAVQMGKMKAPGGLISNLRPAMKLYLWVTYSTAPVKGAKPAAASSKPSNRLEIQLVDAFSQK